MSDAQAITAEQPVSKPLVNPWIIAVAVSIAAFMEVLDTSIANVALPHIAGSLGASNVTLSVQSETIWSIGRVFEMDTASASAIDTFRPQLLDRRIRLLAASDAVPAAYFSELIAEIDAALGRIDNGSYGLCETCRDPIEHAGISLERK